MWQLHAVLEGKKKKVCRAVLRKSEHTSLQTAIRRKNRELVVFQLPNAKYYPAVIDYLIRMKWS